MVLLRKGRHADFQFNQKKNAVPLLGIRSSISINWACYVFLRLAIFFFLYRAEKLSSFSTMSVWLRDTSYVEVVRMLSLDLSN